MNRLFLLIFISFGCTVLQPLQKSKLISVFHLIEIGEYEEAKKLIEVMIEEEDASQWSRIWYARGLLSQSAYETGMSKKQRKFYELYPDQLFLAYESFEKALSLDTRGRLERQLAPRYIRIANELYNSGERHFSARRYEDALKTFEQAITISQNPILTVMTDTSLIYNAALAAYESKNRDKAIQYLDKLHNYGYSPNVSHLLYTTYLEKKDTVAAENVLIEGISRHEDNEDLVILLVDLYYHKDELENALEVLNEATLKDSSNHKFPYTKGLLFQKYQEYEKAIEAYKEAVRLAPEEINSYVNIATSYFNIGVEIDENALTITNNRLVLEEKERSAAAFDAAVEWMEKAHEKDPKNKAIAEQLYQLYKTLRINEKVKPMEGRTW